MISNSKNNIILGIFIILLVSCTLVLTACDADNSENNTKENNLASCTNYSVDECPASCTVCPPCAECSSVSCHDDNFCKNLGFNKTWYDSVKPMPTPTI